MSDIRRAFDHVDENENRLRKTSPPQRARYVDVSNDDGPFRTQIIHRSFQVSAVLIFLALVLDPYFLNPEFQPKDVSQFSQLIFLSALVAVSCGCLVAFVVAALLGLRIERTGAEYIEKRKRSKTNSKFPHQGNIVRDDDFEIEDDRSRRSTEISDRTSSNSSERRIVE